MARKRMLDPSIWDDADAGALSPGAFKTFIGLISLADDEGRLEVSPTRLKGLMWRYSAMTDEEAWRYLEEVGEKLRSVVIYRHDGRTYAALLRWNDYQRIQKPVPSRIPPPDSDTSTVPVRDQYDTSTIPVQYQSRTGTANRKSRIERVEREEVPISDTSIGTGTEEPCSKKLEDYKYFDYLPEHLKDNEEAARRWLEMHESLPDPDPTDVKRTAAKRKALKAQAGGAK